MNDTPNMRKLARQLAAMRTELDAVKQWMTRPQLPHSSLDDASVPEKDETGTVVSRWGKQADGTHGVVDFEGPTPPAPAAPGVEGGPGLLTVTYGGVLSGPRPLDLARIEAYAAEAPFEYIEEADLLGSITGRDGGRLTVARAPGTWHVALVAVSRAEKRSVLSALAEVEVLEAGDSEAVERLAKAFHTDTRPPGPEDVEGRPEGAYWTMIDETGAEAARWRLVDGEWADAPLAPEFIPEAYADFLAANEAFVSQLTASQAFILALSVVELDLLGNLTQINPRGVLEAGYGLFGDTTTPSIRFERTDADDTGPAGITYGSYLQVTRPDGQVGDLRDMGLVMFGPETTHVESSERPYLMLGKFGDVIAETSVGIDGTAARLNMATATDEYMNDTSAALSVGHSAVSLSPRSVRMEAGEYGSRAELSVTGDGVRAPGGINKFHDLAEADNYRSNWPVGVEITTTSNGVERWVRTPDPQYPALQQWVRVWSESGGQPYAQAAGVASVNHGGTGREGFSGAIQFPPGRFTVPPVVIANLGHSSPAADQPRITGITATGATVWLDSTASFDAPIRWQAVQMTPTTAEG